MSRLTVCKGTLVSIIVLSSIVGCVESELERSLPRASNVPSNVDAGAHGDVDSVSSSGGTDSDASTVPQPGGEAPTEPDAGLPSQAACPSGQIGQPPSCFSAPPIAPDGSKHWQVTFSEEFSGTDYDHDKLTPCFDWNSGSCTETFNVGRERYLPSQVRVSNGTVKLVAEPLTPPQASSGCYQGSCTYKSGLLATSRPNASLPASGYLYKFTYGYVESRLKLPGTRGFFTALWMLPAETSYKYRSEIDILEVLGDDPSTMFMTYHYNNRSQRFTPNKGKGSNGACAVKDHSTDFHTFGVDWKPGSIAWYIDGVECGRFNGDASQIENGPMQLIVNLMVDHQWQQDWKVTLQDPTLVRQLELDYIRVYQQVP